MAELSSITVNDLDLNFLIFKILISLVKQYIEAGHSFHIEEYAALRVLGYSAAVDADAGAVGDVLDLGKHFLELERESAFEGVCTGGDKEVGILEGLELASFEIEGFVEEVEGECAGDGFALGLIAG